MPQLMQRLTVDFSAQLFALQSGVVHWACADWLVSRGIAATSTNTAMNATLMAIPQRHNFTMTALLTRMKYLPAFDAGRR
jgi:hypothetical protein